MEAWREQTTWEREVIGRLLEEEFEGRHELCVQLENALVRQIDNEGSLELLIEQKLVAPVTRRIPVEAEAKDSDGMGVHALLHVVDGIAVTLEFYKDDSSVIKRRFRRNEWEVFH